MTRWAPLWLLLTAAPACSQSFFTGALAGDVYYADRGSCSPGKILPAVSTRPVMVHATNTRNHKVWNQYARDDGHFEFLGLETDVEHTFSFTAGGYRPAQEAGKVRASAGPPAHTFPPVPICLVLPRPQPAHGTESHSRSLTRTRLLYASLAPPSPDTDKLVSLERVTGTVKIAAPDGARNPVPGLRLAIAGIAGTEIRPLDETFSAVDGGFQFTLQQRGGFKRYLITASGPDLETATAIVDESSTSLVTVDFSMLASTAESNTHLIVHLEDASRGGNFELARQEVYDAGGNTVLRGNPALLRSLPIPGQRSFDYLALLLPGVAPPPQTIGPPGPRVSPALGSDGQFSANGLRSRENNFTIDGVDNNDEDVGARRQGYVIPGPQSIEAISAFRVLDALYDSQYGKAIGAQVNAFTLTGDRQWHGSAYGFAADHRFNAANFFDHLETHGPSAPAASGSSVLLDGLPLAIATARSTGLPDTRLILGGVLTGPIPHTRASFFASSFEFDRNRAAILSHFAVPTIPERGFRGSGATGLTDPAGNQIYPSTLAGDAIFSLYPFPNNPSGPYGVHTYTAPLNADGDAWQASQRLDRNFHALHSDHLLGGRYNFSSEDSRIPETGGALDSALRVQVQTQSLEGFLSSTPTPSFTNTVRVSWGAARFRFLGGSSPVSGLFPQDPFLLNAPLLVNQTLPGGGPVRFATQGQTEALTGPVGEINLAGYSSLGTDVYRFPQRRANNTFQIADTVSYQIGKRHVLTGGFEIWSLQFHSDVNQNARPRFDFYNRRLFGGVAGSISHPGVGFASYYGSMLDATSFVAAGLGGVGRQTFASSPDSSLQLQRKQIDFFLQDEWRITSSFKLLAGMRFNINRLPESSDGLFEKDYNPQTGVLPGQLDAAYANCSQQAAGITDPTLRQQQLTYCQSTNTYLHTAFPPNFNTVFGADPFGYDPRIGFAWAPGSGGKTVLRGGWGVYTGQFPAILISESRAAFPRYLPVVYILGSGVNTAWSTLVGNGASSIPLQPGYLNLLQQQPAPNLANLFYNALRFQGIDPTQPAANLKNPHSTQFSLTAERSLAQDFIVSAAYVATLGRRLLRIDTPNATQLSVPLLFNAFQSTTPNLPSFDGGSFITGSNLPTFGASIPSVNQTVYSSGATSHYHSLQLEARIRKSRLQAGSSFTWSHAIDDSSDFFDTANGPALPQDSLHPSGERSSSSFDIRLRSVTYFTAVSPLPGRLARDWQLGGVLTLQTGQPFTVTSAADVNQDGNLTDRLDTTAGLSGPAVGRDVAAFDRRTQLFVSDPRLPAFSHGEQLYGPYGCPVNGYVPFLPGIVPGPPPLPAGVNVCDGSIGRNTFRAAGLVNLDLALSRAFRLSETGRLTLRLETFNLLNRSNFAIPVRILEAPAFGQSVTTAAPDRTLRLAIRYGF